MSTSSHQAHLISFTEFDVVSKINGDCVETTFSSLYLSDELSVKPFLGPTLFCPTVVIVSFRALIFNSLA